ncbi:copper amine oxidase N-terminal domain-containing protein [Paenibacillus sp. OAE614]|uniref:copper amine oxidase N-terminal domain-containing protein n=1 Tax=Paenibacillus sp. OAE614 TaxID=2663804 RepID=UPI00178B784A
MKKIAYTLFSAAVALSLFSGSVSAKKNLNLIVNGVPATSAQSYIDSGTTVVPLNIVSNFPGVTITWNNAIKTLNLKSSDSNISLQVGDKFALINNVKKNLSYPVKVEKGRVMVPLRFISESVGASVGWNSHTNTVYVSKQSKAVKEKIESNILSEERSGVLSLPRFDLLPEIKISKQYNEDLTQFLYFTEGKADSFFIRTGDVIRYYKINENASNLTWIGKVDLNKKETNKGLSFLPYKIVQEYGQKPAISNKLVYFKVMLPIMEAEYGFVNQDGAQEKLGQKEVSLNQVFDIQEEIK